jgi:hypothetical protein
MKFESGSKLTQIESVALFSCSSLRVILISRDITELSTGWALESSLRLVIFESALSRRTMTETDKADFQQVVGIKLVDCDCGLDFPGCSIQPPDDDNDSVRLIIRFS